MTVNPPGASGPGHFSFLYWYAKVKTPERLYNQIAMLKPGSMFVKRKYGFAGTACG